MSTKTLTTAEVIQTIDNAAANLVLPETRYVERMEAGQFVRQGDIYLVCLAMNQVPEGLVPTDNRQLAPGTTQGSRHIVDNTVDVFKHPKQGEIVLTNRTRGSEAGHAIGPVIVAKDYFQVTHPEHAHMSLPAGTYQVLGQIDPVELRRVLD